jgi:hypothetical protein
MESQSEEHGRVDYSDAAVSGLTTPVLPHSMHAHMTWTLVTRADRVPECWVQKRATGIAAPHLLMQTWLRLSPAIGDGQHV